MPSELVFTTDPSALLDAESLHFIGTQEALSSSRVASLVPEAARPVWSALIVGEPGDGGRSNSTLIPGLPGRIVTGVLPRNPSRHNSPMCAWAWPQLAGYLRGRRASLVGIVEDVSHARAVAAAIARTLPLYSARSGRQDGKLTVLLLGPDGVIDDPSLAVVADAVRRASWMVDLPPNQFGPDAFVSTAQSLGKREGVSVHVLRRSQLREQGFGGLDGVGRCAMQEPALVVLDWAPEGAKRSVCWIGKGITYDTGGLSLKTKTGMPGMKTDMGGAAAVLAAFDAAVRMKVDRRLTAVLCIAENAIGPDAMRPDDVIKLYSGLTVEVNNTDAEGRLVLADGIAWAAKHRNPEILIDIATLTGAQSVATGKVHGALYCNDEGLEQAAVAAGRLSGDVVHPLPYAPELYRKEFGSSIADMRNSVKDRANAQSSCAGQFIANHIPGWTRPWLHIDIAGPARGGGNRGTGFGVALLLELLER